MDTIVRDQWIPKRLTYEAKISGLLDEAWTVDIDVQNACSNAHSEYSRNSIGSIFNRYALLLASKCGILIGHIIFSPSLQYAYICSIHSYVEGFVRNLEAYLQLYGEEGKTELNTLCTNHSITLEAAKIDRDSGCDVKDGNIRILYREKRFGVNIYSSSVYKVADAVNTAPLPTNYNPQMSFYARQSVRLQYGTQIEEIRLKAAIILNTPSIKFTPNFEQIYDQIKDIRNAMHAGSYWEENLGRTGLSYYKDAFLDVLSRDFAGNEYLVEAFQESVFKNEICLRIVDKIQGYNRFEGVIEDGILYIQVR